MGISARLIKSNVTAKSEIIFERKILDRPSSIHWHNFCELDIIVSGHGSTFINGKECVCKEGMVVFMSPSDLHDYRANELEIFNIQFSEDSVDSNLLHTIIQLKNRMIYMDEKELKGILGICNLMEEGIVGREYQSLYQRKMLESILILFLQSVGSSKKEILPSEPDIIQEIVIYINTNFAENPMLKDVAKAFHINENYLCSLFRQHMGEKYKSYLRKVKLNHAAKMVAFTNLSMTEIALKCGYSTQSHFNREFKNVFHMTPMEMRKS